MADSVELACKPLDRDGPQDAWRAAIAGALDEKLTGLEDRLGQLREVLQALQAIAPRLEGSDPTD